MQAVNFETKNEGTWFYFDEENQELGGVCLRELTYEESRRIDSMTIKTMPKLEDGKWTTESKIDEKKSMELTFGYCIVDWRNVSIDGVLVECNLSTKLKAMQSIDFAKFVSQRLRQLKSRNGAIEEARLKNSEST